MTLKVGDKVKATPAFVAEFKEVEGAVEGLQSEGTVVRTDRIYIEVRLDNGFNIGQSAGAWFFKASELEKL
jgi:hypothetical protein